MLSKNWVECWLRRGTPFLCWGSCRKNRRYHRRCTSILMTLVREALCWNLSASCCLGWIIFCEVGRTFSSSRCAHSSLNNRFMTSSNYLASSLFPFRNSGTEGPMRRTAGWSIRLACRTRSSYQLLRKKYTRCFPLDCLPRSARGLGCYLSVHWTLVSQKRLSVVSWRSV